MVMLQLPASERSWAPLDPENVQILWAMENQRPRNSANDALQLVAPQLVGSLVVEELLLHSVEKAG